MCIRDRYIASQLEAGTEVAQITLNQARINGVLRKDGFDEGIATNNLVDVDFKQMEKVNRSEGETYAQDLITAHPNLGAIFCHSEDPAMGAASALEAAGRTDVLIAAFDCSPEIVEGIRNGSIAGTSAQQPVLMGRNAAQAIVDHLAGKEVEKEITMDTMLVTKDNIDDAVSYTHLDVYKRQDGGCAEQIHRKAPGTQNLFCQYPAFFPCR